MAKIIDPDDLSYVVDATAGGADEIELQTGAKTIQLLALLNVLKNTKPKSRSKKVKGKKIGAGNFQKANLLILSATLVSNWIIEINRFAPSLKYFTAHPSAHQRKKLYKTEIDKFNKNFKLLDKIDLVITTYAFVQKYDWIKGYLWNYIINWRRD